MLSADVRFEGFTATDWTRVLSLFRPRRLAGEQRDPARPRGGVIGVHAAGKLIKLVHTEVGRLRLDEAQRLFPCSADALARAHHASWALILEQGTLEAIMDRFAERTRRGDDITAQTITLAQVAREELTAGRIDLWPFRLRGVPIPAPSMVRGSLDSVCPPGRTMVVGLFEAGELWTSIALRRGPSGVNLILGPDEVRGDMGLLAGDWRRDYRHLARAIEDRCGELAFGCYAEVTTIRKLEVDPNPGAWARAAALRDVILSPLPAPLAIPLGVDAGRAAWNALRVVAERMDPVGVVAPAMAALRDLTTGDRDVKDVFGFHPLELLRKLLSRES
ncbi:MAG: hypothetical protein QM820_19085 [Minicystis sp.]